MTFDVEQLETRGELVGTVRHLLGRAGGTAGARESALAPPFHDAALWRALADVGITGLIVPERYGGSEGTYEDLAAVIAELAGQLYPGPLLGSALLGPTALLASGDEAACRRWLPAMAEGRLVTALISGSARTRRISVTKSGQDLVLRGEAAFVLDASRADVLIIDCCTPERARLAMVDTASDLVRVERRSLHDATRDLATVYFDGARVGHSDIVTGSSPEPMRHKIANAGAVGFAADSLGLGDRMLTMCVEYASVRHQFGRPIGAFQAIKHRCADMFVSLQCARVAVEHAAAVLTQDPESALLPVSIAKSQAGEAAVRVAGDGIQLHGGIGFTHEHAAHMFLKRAKLNEQLFGTSRRHRDRIAGVVAGGHRNRPN